MLEVRHGIMLVGVTFSGKSSCLKVIEMYLKNVSKVVINPKCLSVRELYGYNDFASNQWSDGVLPKKFKALTNINSEKWKWLILDGPVDAI